jgi:hypothetical protein
MPRAVYRYPDVPAMTTATTKLKRTVPVWLASILNIFPVTGNKESVLKVS